MMAINSRQALSFRTIWRALTAPQKGISLPFFRIVFGFMMVASIIRFWANGWIEQLYIKPSYFFTYYGFDWVKPLPAMGMYAVFGLMLLSALFVAAGFVYRVSIVVFFLLFTYVELIDKTTYLNHYYFISLVALLLCFLPAHRMWSLDVKLGLAKQATGFPRWMTLSLQLQMAIVYFFAGIAKINYDWLIEALPLRIWLPAKNDLPLIGPWLNELWVAYLFSWCGMLFDCLVPFFLFWRRTTYWAYGAVLVFHTLTAILFPSIGVFPFVMMVCAAVFLFPSNSQRVYSGVKTRLADWAGYRHQFILSLFVVFFLVQLILPFRYLVYPGKLFWNEQGYRFSWRVMLMEKAGMAIFHVKETNSNRIIEVNNREFLSAQQEKQMSTQPDMILQFAQHLAWVYKMQGWNEPQVFVESYVTLNGKGSRQFIRNDVNLAALKEGFANKWWVLPYTDNSPKPTKGH